MVNKAFLNGMKAIVEAVGFSEPTVLRHKREYPGMPINLLGGVWIGDPKALQQFYKDLAAGKTERYLEPAVPPASKQ